MYLNKKKTIDIIHGGGNLSIKKVFFMHKLRQFRGYGQTFQFKNLAKVV